MQGDSVSPTRVEQSLGAQNETPLLRSTGSRRGVAGAEGRLLQSQMPPGFQGPMFDWNNVRCPVLCRELVRFLVKGNVWLYICMIWPVLAILPLPLCS